MARVSDEYGFKRFLSPDVQEILLNYNWPGNVRELRNIVEQLMVFSTTGQISVCDLPDELSASHFDATSRENCCLKDEVTLREAVHQYERHVIQETLTKYSKTSDAAKILGIDPTTLARKLRKST